MELAKIRKEKGLTQKEAADIIGIPYRTYTRYEQLESYKDSYKYRLIAEDLLNKTKIDEEHGLLSINKIKSLLIPILLEHNINYCYLFGSYAKGLARENSDVDLLVDTNLTGFELLNLIEKIRTTLHKKIDLLRLCDLTADNPIVLNILKEGIRLI